MEKKSLFNMKNKKALSTIIATLLIVVLSIGAAGTVWVVVQNVVEDKLDSSEKCANLLDKIELEEQYTCYDSTAEALQFSINIKDIEVDKILTSVSSDSESKSFEVSETSEFEIGSKNSGRTYTLFLDIISPGTGAAITGFATTCEARDIYTLRESSFTPSSKDDGDAKCAQYLPGYHWCSKDELNNIYGNIEGQTGTGATGTRSLVYEPGSSCRDRDGNTYANVCSSYDFWQCAPLTCENRFCTGQALVCCDDSGTYTYTIPDPEPEIPDCPSNQVWNSDSEQCECPSGTVWDSGQNQCVTPEPDAPVLWDSDYCSTSSPCAAGEGDCDIDADCLTNNCAQNVGGNYGQALSMDVCECSSGTTWSAASQTCVTDTPTCTGGKIWNGASCVCPSGQVWDSGTSQCVVEQTEEPVDKTCYGLLGDVTNNDEIDNEDASWVYQMANGDRDINWCGDYTQDGTVDTLDYNAILAKAKEGADIFVLQGPPKKIEIAPKIEGAQCEVSDTIFQILPC